MPHFYRLLLCCCLVYSAIPLSAQSSLRDGKDYAIFFYCTSFEKGWTSLPETEQEVKAIGDLLRSDYGFEPHYIKNPGKKKIRDEIARWNDRVGPNDQVLYFFSTHGYYDATGDEGFLIPYNGKLRDDYGDTWLSYAELGRRVAKSNSEHVLLALDACYSGAFGDRYKGPPESLPWEEGADCAEQIETALANPTRRFFTSGSKEQRTPASSLFARRWLTALRKGEEKGIVRLYDLEYHLSRIYTLKPQKGAFTGDKDGDFVFVHRSACQRRGGSSSKADAAEQQLWAQAQRLNTEEAYTFYLQAYPNGRYKTQAEAKINAFEQSGSTTTPIRRRDLPDMIFVQGGTFQMGSKDSDAGKDEQPVHTVTVDDFYMHRFEVTFEEYDQFCEATNRDKPHDEGWGRGKRPVINVSWYDAVAYCNWLSEQQNLTPVYTISGTSVSANWNVNGYRLPTEAEWEFAARSRGGSEKWAGTSSEASLSSYANVSGSADGYDNTAPVGSFRPNGLGLKDMTGNVWEWCWDWYDGDYYGNSPGRNPRGPSTGSNRVYRGGSWINTPRHCRAAYRHDWPPTLRNSRVGFRLAHTVE